MLASLVIKIEYRRTLHRGSREPNRSGSMCHLPASEQAPTFGFPATKSPSISCCAPAFLAGSAKYVESDVTHSKHTPATFLPKARIARQPIQSSSKITHLIPLACPDRGRVSHFLTGSSSQTEIAVTHSKQMTGAFLTGARIARQPRRTSSKMMASKMTAPRPPRVSSAVVLHEKTCTMLARDHRSAIPAISPDKLRSE